MEIKDSILEILKKNYNPAKYKSDSRIRTSANRIINEFITYGLLVTDNEGKVNNKDLSKCSNYELLELIDSAINTAHNDVFSDSLINTIIMMDYLGQCWYTPQEIAQTLERQTQKRYNKDRIRRILDELCKENKCLRISNNRYQKNYRINFVNAS